MERRAVSEIIARLRAICGTSERVRYRSIGLASGAGGTRLPRVHWKGPDGGGDAVRIGLFAGIHGDERAGVDALVELIRTALDSPDLARGYDLFFYPICNPHGVDRGCRRSASGKDLNREFWRGSAEAEVRILEGEIERGHFQGLISLHADDTSDGVYGYVRGAVLTRALLEPALSAMESVLPRNVETCIDGFPAENGIISQCFDGILTSPPRLDPAPFEIILETPQRAPEELQVRAFVQAILTVLAEYRKLLAFAPNL